MGTEIPSSWLKQPGREDGPLHLFSVEVKNAWSYTSIRFDAMCLGRGIPLPFIVIHTVG
jgi:hypothetical protein